MEPPRPGLIAVASARPDGGTMLALGLAALLSRTDRTLLIDLNLERAEIAPLLDIEESRTAFHLAYNAQLSPVTQPDLEDHLVWHEGLAVLPGVGDLAQGQQIRNHFVAGLLQAARAGFKHVVCDLGRVRPDLPPAAVADALMWAVAPTPLGIWAFDRAFRQAREAEAEWLGHAHAVVTQEAADSLGGVTAYVKREHGVRVLGELPYEPRFWRSVQVSHSIRALNVEIHDQARYLRAYGSDALRTREALERLVSALAPVASPEPVSSMEG